MAAITQNELKRLFPNASKSVIAANTGMGELETKIVEPKKQPALGGKRTRSKKSGGGLAGRRQVLRITLICYSRRRFDGDNLAGGFKPLRDAIALWLGVDDSEDFVDWQYGQVLTRGQIGTPVSFEKL